MSTHVRVVAILFFVLGAVLTLVAFFSTLLFGILATAAGASEDKGGRVGAAILGFTGVTLTIAALTFAVPSVACGWGLLKRRRWARILAIVLGAFCLVEFPVGTAFGVVTTMSPPVVETSKPW